MTEVPANGVGASTSAAGLSPTRSLAQCCWQRRRQGSEQFDLAIAGLIRVPNGIRTRAAALKARIPASCDGFQDLSLSAETCCD